jgi:membrane-bound lytic murein transglycosylase D
MKKRLSTLSLILFLTHSLVFAGIPQTPADVPESIRFADLNVRFDEGARRIISQDITSLVQSNKKYWEAKLDRVVLYFPLIETILRDEEVPVDLKYLAVQESSLTPDAVSASTAVGYWQFKKETATDHGMRVDDEVDERKSIVASTRGAARYFKRNNAVYNNWVSSLFSYYLGTTGVSKLVPAEWSYAKEVTLDDKTDRYILRFFAHKIAFESVLPAYQTANSVALVEYPYGSGKSVTQVSEDLKISDVEIRKYNRWILGEDIPADKEYVLAIPATSDQVAAIRRQVQKLKAANPTLTKAPVSTKTDTGFPVLRKVNYAKGKPDVVLYEINGLPGIQALAGDNASTLARKARVSLSSFLRYNDMSDRDPITENEVYYLAKKMRKAVVPNHTVQAGETVQSISQMYGIRLKKLLRYNRIDRSDRLVVGRVMWLRERRPSNRPVEIIKMPTTPAPASRPIDSQPNTGTTEPRLSQSSTDRPANNIPKNASERKMYSPKLVGTKESPVPADSRVTTTNTGNVPAPVTSQPVESPVNTTAKPPVAEQTASTPNSTMQNAGSTQRVVIVRPENSTKSEWDATPIRNTAPATTSASRPTERKPVDLGTTSVPVTASVKRPATESLNESAPTVTRSVPVSTTPARSGNSGSLTHKVEAGQTYYSISRLYNVSVDNLLQWNKLTQNDKLAVGQSLVIKGGDEVSKSQPKSAVTATVDPQVTEEIVYHTVQKGETMFRISRQYGVTVEQIQSWNQLSGGGVNAGQQLKIIKK